MLLAFRILSVFGSVAALAWLYHSPDFDSLTAAIAALLAFIGSFIGPAIVKSRHINQTQTVSKGGTGIQAGGNVSYSNSANDNAKKSDAK